MECHLELKGNLGDQKASEVNYFQSSHQACQSTKLGDRFKLDKNESIYADFHPEVVSPKVVRNLDNMPQKSKAFHQKQQTGVKADELVRYMSSLPSYLERGENLQEKAFSIGVLEWRRLEKWQHNHNQAPNRSCKSSPSKSNASSFCSTEGSSSNSGRGHSCSPDNQRMHPSLESNQEPENQSVLSSSKEKMKFHDCKPLEEKKNLQIPSFNHTTDHESMDRWQPVVLHQPKDGQEIRSPTISKQSDLTGKHEQESMETSQHIFSNKSNVDVCGLSSDTPYSCPLPCEANTFRDSQIEKPSSVSEKGIRFSAELLPYSGKASACPSRGRNLEGKKSTKTLESSTEASNLQLDTEEDRKIRNPSPIRRFMDRIGRNSSSKDASCASKNNLDTDKICSRGAETSVSSIDSSCDKSNATGKGRSSPLRRLLDPLIKSRASNFDCSIGSSQGDSSPIDKACRLSKGRGESAARPSVKVKLDLGSCKTINIDHPQGIGKCRSSTVQALLQVAVKNGLPLFTFAVDSSGDVLAATMRKLSSSKKNGNSWIYTFFTVHEMKKRNSSWLNQGNKDRVQGYIPNVVAQMKVSDVASRYFIRQRLMDQRTIREFVLVAANKRRGNQQTSDLQENDELAAIVLKLPKMALRNLNEADQRMKVEKLSAVDLKVPSQEVCSFSESIDIEESGSSAGSMDLFDLAVILPGGDHGLPSKGEPSPLIERWRLGGSCDCGGWDLGCRLRVLASQFSRTSGSAKAQSSTGKFQLYSQEQGLERKCIFSLSQFKDGIYSVEFDSSLKHLQAFSICIALLNGLQPANFSETDGLKVSKRDQQENSKSNVFHPPISPVEKV